MISPLTICYALKMTHDFLRSEYLCEKTECNRKRLDEFSAAVDEIDNGTLEIEGYERATWTKLNPNDSKTFPKRYPVLILLNYGGIDICTLFFDGKFQTGTIDSYSPNKITHWRPLPKPPTETEEAK